MARYQPRHRKMQTIWLLFVGLITFSAVLVGGALFLRTSLIEFGIKLALEDQDLGPWELTVQKATHSELVIGPVSLSGGTLSIASIEADYSWQSLQSGSLENILISDLRMAGNWTESGVSFGQLDRLRTRLQLESDEQTETPETVSDNYLPPFKKINIENAIVSIDGPQGTITVSSDMGLEFEENTFAGEILIKIGGPNLTGNVRWSGALDFQNFLASNGTGAIQIEADTVRFPGSEQSISASVDVDIIVSDGVLAIESERDLNISAPWPDAFDPFETPLDPGKSFQATLGSNTANTPILRLQQEDEGVIATVDLDFGLTSQLGGGAFDFAGWVSLGQNGLPHRTSYLNTCHYASMAHRLPMEQSGEKSQAMF